MKKTRLFKHFITLIHCCALAIPLFTLIGTFIFNYLAPTAYFASHKNAASSTYDIQYKYQSNEINNVDDLLEGNIYYLNCEQMTLDEIFVFNSGGYVSLIFINIDEWDFSEYSYTEEDRLYQFYNSIYPIEIVFNSDFIGYFYLPQNENDSLFSFMFDDSLDTYFFTLKGVFILNSFDNIYGCNNINYTDYNEIESVEIENHNDFEDMKNYQPKTFDDACFYTMQSMGVSYEGDGVVEVLYNSTGENIYAVRRLYDLGYSCTDFYAFNGVINYDWLEMFNLNLNFKENTTNGSWYFFINFYINYFINVSLILFMPIVIMGFLKFCTNLILKFIEKGEDY